MYISAVHTAKVITKNGIQLIIVLGEFNMKFGEKLYKLRKDNSMSQEKLAERLSVSRQAISKWEQNVAVPDTDNIVLISKFFQVPVEYLLFDKYDSVDQIKRTEQKDSLQGEKTTHKCNSTTTIIIGFILLLVAVVMSFVFQFLSLQIKGECFSNALEYLKHLPMILLVGLGVGLVGIGVYKKRSESRANSNER